MQLMATGNQMQNPFFSIILPTYNRAHMIGKAIESVLAQTYTNWELLIIDDGSTDNTKQVIETYTDNRIRYLYQQNAERSAARNNGIAHAQGQYICFIDSDDYYFANHLSTFDYFIVDLEDMILNYSGLGLNDIKKDTIIYKLNYFKNVENISNKFIYDV